MYVVFIDESGQPGGWDNDKQNNIYGYGIKLYK